VSCQNLINVTFLNGNSWLMHQPSRRARDTPLKKPDAWRIFFCALVQKPTCGTHACLFAWRECSTNFLVFSFYFVWGQCRLTNWWELERFAWENLQNHTSNFFLVIYQIFTALRITIVNDLTPRFCDPYRSWIFFNTQFCLLFYYFRHNFWFVFLIQN
jgi:hypothetical protein